MLHLSLPAFNTNKSMDLPHAHVFYPGTIPLPQRCKVRIARGTPMFLTGGNSEL